MAISQPLSTDKLSNPDHSLMHRIIACDPAADVQSIAVDSDNVIGIKAGIAFPSTAVPSADPNTLDDYEEGTFTPVLTFGGGSTGITYSFQKGSYVKIGDLVSVNLWFYLSSKGTDTGDAVVTGLPFSVRNDINCRVAWTVIPRFISFADIITGHTLENNAAVTLSEVTNAGETTAITNADFIDTSRLYISGVYKH